MNSPFFRNYANQQPSRSARPIPVQRSSPKVVSVPVHFISSEQPPTTLSMLKDSAALNIQKVFRGFIVRKSVKKVASIRNEVSEIERRINDIQVIDLIRRDAKERLRVNETLMSLLFKLDSIPGVDFGVRVLRKAVTRKAIALQEKVDSIAQAHHQTLDPAEINASEQLTGDPGNVQLQAVEDDADGSFVVENCDPVNGAAGTTCDDVEGGMETSPTDADLTEIGKEDHTSSSIVGSMEVQKDEEDNDDKGNTKLLKKLMSDNDKMMKLMMQISERNEMQTRMINSLSRRVEQLEKAFMTDKLRRRKKKTHVALRRRDKDNFSV